MNTKLSTIVTLACLAAVVPLYAISDQLNTYQKVVAAEDDCEVYEGAYELRSVDRVDGVGLVCTYKGIVSGRI